MVLFKSKKIVGLDIGTSSIKLAELYVSGRTAHLSHFAMVETPKTGIAGGEIIDVLPIAEAVRFVCEEAKTKVKQTATGLWGPSVIVKKISIPKMDKKLAAEQIKWEAEQYIPFEISDVNLDFHFLSTTNEDEDSMDILLIAARRDQIMKYIEIIESSGQTCSIVDVNGIALANCFEYNLGKPKEPTVVLNIGAQYTNFIVINGSDTLFCRDISVGGDLYSSEIQKSMNMSYDEAEALKLSAAYNTSMPEELGQVIESAHETFCNEIQGSMEFFLNTTPGVNISKVYVTGGGSRTPGIVEALSQELQLEIEVFNPLLNIKVSKSLGVDFKSQYGDFISVALGLGLRKAGDA